MRALQKETKANFLTFSERCKKDLDSVWSTLRTDDPKFLQNYRSLTSFQAWRTVLLEDVISAESLAFFLEAQNDALTAHVFARMGSWRASLQAMRSCLENIVFCIYYKDHPVELELWHCGRHRLGFAETLTYLKHHPKLQNLPRTVTGLQELENEYSTLSRAVHASAKSFRMTVDAHSTILWNDNAMQVGIWMTRQRKIITSLNLLLLCLFSNHLSGASFPNLRKAVSLAVPPSKHAAIRRHLKVSLPHL